MTIPQPELYIKKYKDFSDEMLASIPKYTERWTNHNPSDPGIVILEMLAWIMDTTLYRIDRTPEEMYVSFLRLVAGSAGLEDVRNLLNKQGLDRHYREILTLLEEVESGKKKSIEEIKSAALNFLGSRFRAVTEEDFRMLAIEATDENSPKANGEDSPKVKRAIVSAKGKKVEIIVVPDKWEELLTAENDPKYEELIKIVSEYLDLRRLIGTVIEVKMPVITEVIIDMEVQFSPNVKHDIVTDQIRKRIRSFLNPFVGGDQGNGWVYGRSLTTYEVAQLVEETEGVENICNLIFDGNKALEVKKTEGFFRPNVREIKPKVHSIIINKEGLKRLI